jgi:hypothetical protein
VRETLYIHDIKQSPHNIKHRNLQQSIIPLQAHVNPINLIDGRPDRDSENQKGIEIVELVGIIEKCVGEEMHRGFREKGCHCCHETLYIIPKSLGL